MSKHASPCDNDEIQEQRSHEQEPEETVTTDNLQAAEQENGKASKRNLQT